MRVNNGKSIVPVFNVFTEVPIPTRLRGLIVDDINFSTDPRSTVYGEKQGVPFAPVGIYDFTNRLVTTVESDFNGMYDVLLPSTNHISCPTPSGVCANMYRFVGNDPGIPGRLNPNFNPRYRTIATEFEALPGLIIPTDLAPTQVGVTIGSPTTGVTNNVACSVEPTTPQLFAVSQPYVNGTGTFTINGAAFGAAQGAGEGHPRRRSPGHHLVERHDDRRDGAGRLPDGTAPARDHRRQRPDERQRPDLPRDRHRLHPDRP